MADHGRGKKEEDPEKIQRRKFRMKCLFRAMGRLVISNIHWLKEASEAYEGVEDVKRRVELTVRSAGKKKQLLSINDKTLLNKPAEDRTDQEKKYLYRIIGGLKCFKRYPNNVKRKLAAVTYFKYYGPGRTIVRQHQESHALYFIVSGDVVVTQMMFDELLHQNISVEVGALHSGEMFGEVSLLHNIPRTATVTTTGHCELLALMKDDFKRILQGTVQKQWDEVRRAMSYFSYFQALDEVARREGCIVAKMKSYAPDDTLLGDGVGVHNFVYFITSGKCQMIESMQVIVSRHLGRNSYTLYDPRVSKQESEPDFDFKYFPTQKPEDKRNRVAEDASSTCKTIPLINIIPKSDSLKHVAVEERSINSSKLKLPSSSLKSEIFTVDSQIQSENIPSLELLRPTDRTNFVPSLRLSLPTSLPTQGPARQLQTYFMQVCQLKAGSSFGFGENMRDRRIVALTPVTCMLLPLVWLLQRNTANIWTRIKHYLDKKILSKEQLFQEFVAQRRWVEYREQMVDDIVSRSNTVNSTTVHDVPYSIRAEELLEF